MSFFPRVCSLLAVTAALSAAVQGDEPKGSATQSILVDFGSGGRLVTAGWNNITDPQAGDLVLRSAVDASGKATSVAIRQVDGWAGFNTNGFRQKGPYPPTAMGDSFYLQAGIDTQAKLRVEGLTPGEAYRFTFFASRMGGEARRTGRYTIGDRHVQLNAANNTAASATIEDVQPDRDGAVTLLVECPEGEEYAYLGVLEIEGAFGEAGQYRLPADPLDGPPLVTARAWAIGDGNTGKLLWGDNESASRHMASTTKIMTALIVVELAKEEPQVLEELVTVSVRADKTGGSSARLNAGETLTVGDLLYGLLLPSGNDAAVALAEHFGNRLTALNDSSAGAGNGSDEEQAANGDPLARFVAEMNRRAAALQMKRTHYLDPHGNSANRSSAHDLLRLAFVAMQNETFRRYVNTPEHRCTLTGKGGTAREAVWKNTNQLLGISGFDGVKTGTTGGAGACLVSSGRRDGDHLLVVVLGSTSRDGRYVDTRNLFRWAWREREHPTTGGR